MNAGLVSRDSNVFSLFKVRGKYVFFKTLYRRCGDDFMFAVYGRQCLWRILFRERGFLGQRLCYERHGNQ
jgi:hypothetical protein